ncbi:MAG: Hpt domain-containing protein [Deltaproteobacteria bacterium]|nr:Hpt domain-containing protein [Deltaproteobacteria bacterium]
MPENDNSNEVINIKELNEIMDDDTELIHECFVDFIQEWPKLYVEIKGAVLEKDTHKLDESSHKLKGTLRYLAAGAAADAAYALESAGKKNDLEGVEKKLLTLKNECQRLVDYINNFNQ